MSEFVCPKCGSVLAVAAKTVESKKTLSLENVRALFPSKLEELLSFEETDQYVIVRPRRFLGSEDFARIAHIVRTNKGEYISAGKDSHFRVSKN